MKEIMKAALMAAVMGFIASFMPNLFILPVPSTTFANAFGNGMSGFAAVLWVCICS